MRAIEPLAAIVLLAFLVAPAAAQIRYKDDEGVTHFVDSINDVPEKYRAGAIGRPTPAPRPATQPSSGTDWEKKAQDAKRDAERERTAAEQQRAQMEARCEARERALEKSLPEGAMVDKYQIAAALGPDCDVDAILARRLERLKTNSATRSAAMAECNRRLAASGADQRKIQTANMMDARERNGAWLEVARAIGNQCADVLVGRP